MEKAGYPAFFIALRPARQDMTPRKPDPLPPADASSRRSAAGFTMVELVVTMVVVGILAVTVLPRFGGLGAFDAAGYADQTQELLRYAQKSAIAQRRWVAVDLAADPPSLCSQTSLPGAGCAANCVGGGNASPIALPGGTVGRPKSSTTFGAGSSTLLCFDALGRPIAAGASVPGALSLGLTVNDAGAPFRSITIEHETGYVH